MEAEEERAGLKLDVSVEIKVNEKMEVQLNMPIQKLSEFQVWKFESMIDREIDKRPKWAFDWQVISRVFVVKARLNNRCCRNNPLLIVPSEYCFSRCGRTTELLCPRERENKENNLTARGHASPNPIGRAYSVINPLSVLMPPGRISFNKYYRMSGPDMRRRRHEGWTSRRMG